MGGGEEKGTKRREGGGKKDVGSLQGSVYRQSQSGRGYVVQCEELAEQKIKVPGSASLHSYHIS